MNLREEILNLVEGSTSVNVKKIQSVFSPREIEDISIIAEPSYGESKKDIKRDLKRKGFRNKPVKYVFTSKAQQEVKNLDFITAEKLKKAGGLQNVMLASLEFV